MPQHPVFAEGPGQHLEPDPVPTLLLEALRDAIRASRVDDQPDVLPFSFALPGELAPVQLHCVCEPEPFGGFIIGLDSDALGRCRCLPVSKKHPTDPPQERAY